MAKSEEKKTQEVEKSQERYDEVTATLETRKEELAELRDTLKELKDEHKIKSPKKIKDKEVLKKYNGLTKEIKDIQNDIKNLKAEAKAVKPRKSGGFEGKYDYKAMQVKDPETGELREMTKSERKRWRGKARRIANKEDITSEAVPFDPNFLMPTPKKEKPKKEKKEKAPKAEKKATKKVAKKVKKTKKADQEED